MFTIKRRPMGAFAIALGSVSSALAVTAIRAGQFVETTTPATALNDEVHVLHHFAPDGHLYAGGAFTASGRTELNRVGRWDIDRWTPLGAPGAVGFDAPVYALATFDDGSGPALYAGGEFTEAGGVPVGHIARWTGGAWEPLGAGVTRTVPGAGYVGDMLEFDDGSGPSLFVTGVFNRVGSTPTFGIGRWDGSAWHAVGGGLNGGGFDLTLFDDGTGVALYVGGYFTAAGGTPAWGVARWDGVQWSRVGDTLTGSVNALAVFDDGSGPKLFAGGTLDSLGGVVPTFDRVACFDGASWGPVGGGVDGGFAAKVNTFCVFDDGTGFSLYAGGNFLTADGQPARGLARWDGTSWASLPSGGNGLALFGRVDALEIARSPSGGAALYIGGSFAKSLAGDAYFTRLE